MDYYCGLLKFSLCSPVGIALYHSNPGYLGFANNTKLNNDQNG